MAIVKQYDKRRNVTYLYESHSTWIPELGQPRAKRKLIGRLDPETGQVVPTARRGQPKKDANAAAESRLTEENSRMREELIRAKQEIQDLTQTVRKLKSQNERLTKSVLKMSSTVKKLNEEMGEFVSQMSQSPLEC